MEYVIYIDVIFLTDFLLNILALYFTSVFLRQRAAPFRVVLASVVGGIWNCFLVLYPVKSQAVILMLTVLGVGSFMNLIAGSICLRDFQSNTRNRFWRYLGMVLKADTALLISSALLQGCLSLVQEHFFLSYWESLLFLAALTGAVGGFLQETMKQAQIGRERYSVFLYFDGKMREFTALADSGNRLQVPETGKPVALISYRECVDFCDKVSGGFFIPYRAVGTEHGLLFAITFEKMEIRKSGTCIKIENPVVAITKESLSSDGDFNMILPEDYILESN